MAVASAPSRLAPYVPRIAAEWELDAPGRAWQEVDGTLCFADVSGFTRLSERLAERGRVGAEELTDILTRVFGTMLELAYQRGGNLLKFGGDALLLLFRGPDHAVQASCAAVEMRAALREATREPTSVGPIVLRMSQGLHAGPIHLFSVGRSHQELVITGPGATVTTAMEAVADAGEIVVSPQTAARLPDGAVGAPRGPGWGLRWRRPPLPPREPAPRLWVEPERIDGCIPTVLRQHLSSGYAVPEHRIATVGFVRFLGVDRRMAVEGPDAVAGALGELVVVVQDAVDAEGVTLLATDIDQDGGKVILTTGVPHAQDDDDGRMLRAVRRVVDSVSLLPVKVGVNRGHVFAGEVGNHHRRTYTVMGDTVNLAARYMSNAEPGQVLASRAVLDGSQTRFVANALEPFLVKGKRDPVVAWSVGPETDAPSPDIAATEADLPLVGRSEEMAILLGAWRSARRGQGKVVELIGDAGVGKSRLIEEVLSLAGDARRVRAECRLYQSTTPYFPFRTILRQALELDGLGEPATIDRLRALATELAPSTVPWLSLVGDVLDIDLPESDEVRALEDRFRRARREEAVIDLLAAVLTEPTIAVIEDAHYMDEASRELFTSRIPDVEALPWLVCFSRRSGQEGFEAPDGPWLQRIEVGPLGDEAVGRLVEMTAGDLPLRADQIRALAARSDGNPLFALELLRALVEAGEIDVDALPASVEGLIEVRIDRLPTASRNRLRQLAVLGSTFRAEHAAVVLDDESAEPARALSGLREFVRVDGSGWVRFRHTLTRDVAYAGLPFRTRRRLHARVADSILAATDDDGRSAAELLSFHYFHAARWVEAWHHSRVAGDAARSVFANLDAARLLERAVRAGRQVPGLDTTDLATTWSALGEVREQVGQFDAALDALREASRLVGDDGPARAELHLERAKVLGRTGNYGRGLRETAVGLRLVGDATDQLAAGVRARLLAFRGYLRVQQGKAREALALARRAAEEAAAIGERRALAEASVVLDAGYEMLGQLDHAVHAPTALAMYEELNDFAGVAVVTANMGIQAYAEGRWDAAIGCFSRAQETLQRSGNEAQAAVVEINIAEVLINQGRLAAAEPIARHATRALRAHNFVDMVFSAETQLARVSLERGQLDDAIATLARVTAEATAVGRAGPALEAAVYLATAHTRLGRPGGALEILHDAAQAAGEVATMFEASIARVRAVALGCLGRFAEAFDEVSAGLEAAREQQMPYEEALLRLVRCELSQVAGREPDPADEQEAPALLQRLGVARPPAV